MLWETIKLATQSIRRNALRSILTLLGIVIGVAAVIAMVTIGSGSSARVQSDLAKLGSNMLIVVPGTAQGMQQSTVGAPLFPAADLEAVSRQSPDVALISAAGSRRRYPPCG